MLDSQVAVMALLNGYSRAPGLNNLVQRILCGSRATYYVKWIPSEDNVADGPSRGLIMSTINKPTYDQTDGQLTWYGGAWRSQDARAPGIHPDGKDVGWYRVQQKEKKNLNQVT